MSYRLIDANALAANCKQVNDMPCIYADLPNGLDGGFYDMTGQGSKSRWAELFGTPERAANVVLALQICPCVKDECAFCPACDVCFEHYKGGRTIYEMAEWLRGGA